MKKEKKFHQECDACGFVTDVKPYDRQGIGNHGQTKLLCALCAGGMTGTAMDYGHMKTNLDVLQTICYVGNAILAAIAQQKPVQVVPKPDRRACAHRWEEQPGEPPMDVCVLCGAVRR